MIRLLLILLLSACFATSAEYFKTGGNVRFSQRVTITTSTISTPAPTADLLWWKLNEGTGTSFTGTVGPNGSAGAGANGYVTGANGLATNAFDFGPENTALSDSSVTYGANVITVCYWVYHTTWGGVRTIISSKSDKTTANTWRIDNDEGSVNYVMQGTTVPNITRSTLAAPSNSAWHHYAVVFDASTATGAITIYVDGALASPAIVDTAKDGTSNFAANALRVGNLNGTEFWTGYMDDIRIYATALSAGQVAAIYASPE